MQSPDIKRGIGRYTSLPLLLFLLAACGSIEATAEAPPSTLVPTRTATEVAFDCSAANFSDNEISSCAELKDKSIAGLEMLKAVASSAPDPAIRQLLLDPILDIENLANMRNILIFWQFTVDHAAGVAFYGCQPERPFYAEIVLPKLSPSEREIEADGLTTRWHEFTHIARAWTRFQAGDTCPYISPEDEEYEVSYWSDYFFSLAAQVGYVQPDKQEKMNTWGTYPSEIVAQVLVPRGIDFRSPLYRAIHLFSLDGLVFRFYISRTPEVWEYYPQEDHDRALETEREWNEVILPNLTQNEREAVLEMVDLGLVHPRFFPTLPERP